ncbi:MAG: HDIG domain-containing protein [Candidatus Ratteibacteria bacterium]|nr:HDIG domain-containing protein [Candidatus Ratteibacteria bacterium]
MEKSVFKKIYEIFKKEKGEIFLVGGSVRDMLMNKELTDFDFATSLPPQKTRETLNKNKIKNFPVGIAFGTVGAIIDGKEVHITTYRKKETYRPRNRKPAVEFGETLKEDLKRRDFTINTLAISPDGKIIDMYNGAKDLSEKLILTPSNPDESFEDDPLRILRAFRFQSQLGFKIENTTYKAIEKNAFRLMYISEERIQAEMTKLLLGDFVVKALAEMMNAKVLNFFIPELYPLKNLHQESEQHHKDVWLHTLKVVENTPKDATLRWATLLHDIGKPYVKAEEKDQIHFYRHEELGAKMAYSILSRLKFPKELKEDISFLISKHMRANLYTPEWTDSAVRRFIKEMGARLDKVLILSRCDITSYRKEKVREKIKMLDELSERINSLNSIKGLKYPLSGNDIMEYFNLPPGRLIGKIKEFVMNEVIEGRLPQETKKEIYFEAASTFLRSITKKSKN